MFYKSILFCSLLVIFAMPGQAQLYSRLISEYVHIDSVFLYPNYQRFNVNYYYSTEKNPNVYVDSLRASFQVHGGNYFGNFGNNTVMQNSQYLLSFYGANGTVMVSNPVKNKTGAMQGVHFDSVFFATNVDSAWISDQGTIRTIQYRFTAQSLYKSCTVTYSKSSYALQKIVYCMKQQMQNPADTVNLPANPLVTIQFFGYNQSAFSDTIFDHNRYVKRDSIGNFRGVGAYVGYEVLSTYRAAQDSGSGGPTSMLKTYGTVPVVQQREGQLIPAQTFYAFVDGPVIQQLLVFSNNLNVTNKLAVIKKGRA